MRSIINAPCKLKKCPWCKNRPNLYKEALWNGTHGYRGNYTYYIKCDNKMCKINPVTKKYNDVYDKEDSCINNVCNDWNNRGSDNNEEKQTTEVQNKNNSGTSSE